MDREQCIITVYCLICDHYQALTRHQPIRHGGFAPALSDEEVLTIEICGELFHCANETQIFTYFQYHYQAWFPHLRDRTLFIRQAANLAPIVSQIQHRLTVISGQAADPTQIIDTLPLPVCVLTRAPRDRCFKPQAEYGHCAAKQLTYYGFKLGLRIARSGMITACWLLQARPHDVQFLETLAEHFTGTLIGDKGFLDAERHARLAERHGVTVITPTRKNMAIQRAPALLQTCQHLRKAIETVGSQLTQWFGITRIHARDLRHYQHHLMRKLLAHTVGVFLNLRLGRRPLALAGLLTNTTA